MVSAELSGPWRFRLVRVVDETGVSGVGHVADGAQFQDGTCVLRWRGVHASTAFYTSVEDLQKVWGPPG